MASKLQKYSMLDNMNLYASGKNMEYADSTIETLVFDILIWSDREFKILYQIRHQNIQMGVFIYFNKKKHTSACCSSNKLLSKMLNMKIIKLFWMLNKQTSSFYATVCVLPTTMGYWISNTNGTSKQCFSI